MFQTFNTFTFKELLKPTFALYFTSILLIVGYSVLYNSVVIKPNIKRADENVFKQSMKVRLSREDTFVALEKTINTLSRPDSVSIEINCFISSSICDVTFKNKFFDKSKHAIEAKDLFLSYIPQNKKSAN
ncbi:hypothetical protein [Pseudoalteromonas sp. G4]|uniref:hypothetical protein n=1 Tax=Pseudoalteromonas sp. G4 TaxID=2992761 RepID=UPI00237D452C|nr:hypothetical protein [Pseudoalteromonas sp. G4]MDE3272424.1 hypothetical protein [Pseudoalteromonas sp. G4]